ncbi:MAG: S-adenosylmethionine:tRNA ribosyltransferase-isomerase, partial [Acidimicrobiales bacterium]
MVDHHQHPAPTGARSVTRSRPTVDFDYDLPETAIAQTPLEPRDRARMLVALGAGAGTGSRSELGFDHRTVAELDEILRPGDLLVVNDTRVLAARLNLFKPTGGAVAVLLLEPIGDHGRWQALVRPSKRVVPGTVLELDGRPMATVGQILPDGRRLVD